MAQIHNLGKIHVIAVCYKLQHRHGDVVICNRQLLHGSFPNCGFEPRVTVNFGFHKRSSVIGTQGGGIHSEAQVFDDEIIERRS